MKNLSKLFLTGITLLSVSGVLQAFEYTDRPPGTVSGQGTYSNPNSPTVNPPGTPSTNPPGRGSVSQPNLGPENSIRENKIRENSLQTNPADSANSFNSANTSSYNYSNSNRNLIGEADTSSVKTHNGTIVDDDIVQKVKWAIKNDPTLSSQSKSIQVSVKDGAVTLMGTVKDPAERQKVEAAVKQIQGVKSINSKLSSANQ